MQVILKEINGEKSFADEENLFLALRIYLSSCDEENTNAEFMGFLCFCVCSDGKSLPT